MVSWHTGRVQEDLAPERPLRSDPGRGGTHVPDLPEHSERSDAVPRPAARPGIRSLPGLLWRTFRDAREDRISGLAAEIAFFLLLGIPPALLIVAGGAGYIGDLLGPDVRESLRSGLVDGLGTFLSPETMREFVRPAVDDIFAQGRAGVLSVGVLIALWSASRIARVSIEAVNIAYDIEEWRPAWRRRLLAVGLTLGGLTTVSIALPFIVAGPRLGDVIADRTPLPAAFGFAWQVLYWPVAVALGIALLVTFYHLAPNWHTSWRRDVPGAVVAAALWIAAAFGLRVYVDLALTERTVGPLAAPIIIVLWLYVSALAVLFGAELNAEIERMWPSRGAHLKETPENVLPTPQEET